MSDQKIRNLIKHGNYQKAARLMIRSGLLFDAYYLLPFELKSEIQYLLCPYCKNSWAEIKTKNAQMWFTTHGKTILECPKCLNLYSLN